MEIHRIILVLLVVFVSSFAHAFGSPGHMAVGNLADKLIEGTAAEDQVKAILGTKEKLQHAAIWPDCARGVAEVDNGFDYRPDPKYHDKHCAIFETKVGKNEMIDYVSRNWDNCEYSGQMKECHKAFHFADIPLQLGNYSDKSVGAGEQDVVHGIIAAIAFLKDGTRIEPFRFGDGNQGRKEALRLLTHLLGDIHQPLHVGAVYLTPNGRATNPNKTKRFSPASETRGGNSLKFGSSDNLHHDWDTILASIANEDYTGEAATVLATDGPMETWAAKWATESVLNARIAYKGLVFGKKTSGADAGWPTVFKDRVSYLKMEREMQKEQITKAGARLAEILQTIWTD